MSNLDVGENDLFVVYVNEDAPWVRGDLLPSLRMSGAVVIEEINFTLGSNRIAEVERVIGECRAVVLIISAAFLASPSAEFIETLARSHDLEHNRWSIIPVILEDVPLPPRIRMAVSLEAYDEDGRRDAIIRLCMEYGRRGHIVTPQSIGSTPGNGDVARNTQERLFTHAERLASIDQRIIAEDARMGGIEQRLGRIEDQLGQILSYQRSQPIQPIPALSASVPLTINQVLFSIALIIMMGVFIFGVSYVAGR